MLLTRKDILSQAQSPKVGHKQLGDSFAGNQAAFSRVKANWTDGDGCFEEYKIIQFFEIRNYVFSTPWNPGLDINTAW